MRVVEYSARLALAADNPEASDGCVILPTAQESQSLRVGENDTRPMP